MKERKNGRKERRRRTRSVMKMRREKLKKKKMEESRRRRRRKRRGKRKRRENGEKEEAEKNKKREKKKETAKEERDAGAKKAPLSHLRVDVINNVVSRSDGLCNILQTPLRFSGVFRLERGHVIRQLINGGNDGGATLFHVSGVGDHLTL